MIDLPIRFISLDTLSLPEAEHTVIISDKTVAELYGHKLQERLHCQLLVIPDGEASKCQAEKTRLEEAMLAEGMTRNTLVIALGGGVVGDLAGFVAATYMRGVPLIQIPTTLLAMVDSSVGGKTAINTPYGKNLIGAFWPSTEVLVDIQTLRTLSEEQLKNGLVEALKMFLTHDAESFHWAREHRQNLLDKDEAALKSLVERSVRIKAGVVARDERERGERALLNAGHTVGHALERLNNYKMLHGHAVAQGLLIEAAIADKEGHLSSSDLALIQDTFDELELPSMPYEPSQLYAAMNTDKKSDAQGPRMVMLTGIGSTLNDPSFTHPLKPEILNSL